jgi:hypothetical protein
VKTAVPKATSLFLSLAVMLVLAPLTAAAIPQDNSPLNGTWDANISKSKRHPNHLFKSARLTFAVSDGVVTLTNGLPFEQVIVCDRQ